MPSITLSNLSVGYQHPRRTPTTVLAQLNATLHAGQLTCLVGANGIGKSTLLRTLAAFQPPIAGQMHYYSGEQAAPINLATLSQARLARLVSVVLTAKPSVENLSVEQIVALGRSPYTNIWGTLRADDRRMAAWAMDVVGITGLRHRLVQTLSDGERQKMMIAKALAQDTPVILLDEPTAFLDYKSKVEVLGLLARLAHETNKMVLLSTHDLEQVVHACYSCPLRRSLPTPVAMRGRLQGRWWHPIHLVSSSCTCAVWICRVYAQAQRHSLLNKGPL